MLITKFTRNLVSLDAAADNSQFSQVAGTENFMRDEELVFPRNNDSHCMAIARRMLDPHENDPSWADAATWYISRSSTRTLKSVGINMFHRRCYGHPHEYLLLDTEDLWG